MVLPTIPAAAQATTWLLGGVINTALLGLAWRSPKKLLTPAGYLHAWGLGVLIWGCLGWRQEGLRKFSLNLLCGNKLRAEKMCRIIILKYSIKIISSWTNQCAIYILNST